MPCIVEVVKASVAEGNFWILKYVNNAQLESIKDVVKDAVKNKIAAYQSMRDSLVFYRKYALLKEFLDFVPKNMSNYNEIALIVAGYGKALYTKHMPKQVVDKLYETSSYDNKQDIDKYGDFDIIATVDKFLATNSNIAAGSLVNEESKFIYNEFQAHMNEKDANISI